MSSLHNTFLLVLLVLSCSESRAAAAEDCYQFGSGGWDLTFWGENPRLPPTKDGSIPICAGDFGGVVFRWRTPQGVFLIPSEQCPSNYTDVENARYKLLAPVQDRNTAGFVWVPEEPGTYWVTSPVPGACESGVKVRVDVISLGSGATAAWRHAARLALLAGALVPAALLLV